MRFTGVLPEDAPDPRLAEAGRLAAMPVPVHGLVTQPALDDVNPVSTASGSDATGLRDMSVSISYTLWRDPADRSSPVNLAALDDATRRVLDEVPPWPRPAWLVEQVERMRYPLLWEAVRTTWYREPSPQSSVVHVLLEHVHHVHRNRFPEELGLGRGGEGGAAPRVPERAVNPRASIQMDGVDVPAFELDTDPYVYAIGAAAGSAAGPYVVTAVIPRDELRFVRVEFERRPERP